MSCVVGCLACRVPLGRILDGENRVRMETWLRSACDVAVRPVGTMTSRDAGGKGRRREPG